MQRRTESCTHGDSRVEHVVAISLLDDVVAAGGQGSVRLICSIQVESKRGYGSSDSYEPNRSQPAATAVAHLGNNDVQR